MSQQILQQWLDAGYTKFSGRSGSLDLFLLQKRFSDDKGVRYTVDVSVVDLSDIEKGDLGFTPRAFFNTEVATGVTLHTEDPAVAEERFAAIWQLLDKPYKERF